ncbi:adenine nucleotide alpha hydrolases-like protein [Hesseltinella vesiculosa]|uniref:Adenine nucleotide alpha hydrolases-like protein n=1 Tax=Hesseltinella vesiculosa TaxID=101127 RepID=A0A1X2GM42_9FUNG|nr:adenine nucleotide alpha hydrolases-like protein [Hesseltinella vesiculosa]
MAVSNSKESRVVSFDTMSNVDLPNYSFTLRRKTPDYKRTRRSRTFMLCTNLESYSDHALQWTISQIMDDGDELVVVRVLNVELSDKRNVVQAQLQYEAKQAKDRAMEVIDRVLTSAGPDIKFSVVIEFVIGKVHETIQQMIAVYQPSMLIVGTRGLSEFKGMFIGSVSKYCLQHVPIPVVVVRPEGAKQAEKKNKKGNRLSAMMRRGKDLDGASISSSTSTPASTALPHPHHLLPVPAFPNVSATCLCSIAPPPPPPPPPANPPAKNRLVLRIDSPNS